MLRCESVKNLCSLGTGHVHHSALKLTLIDLDRDVRAGAHVENPIRPITPARLNIETTRPAVMTHDIEEHGMRLAGAAPFRRQCQPLLTEQTLLPKETQVVDKEREAED